MANTSNAHHIQSIEDKELYLAAWRAYQADRGGSYWIPRITGMASSIATISEQNPCREENHICRRTHVQGTNRPVYIIANQKAFNTLFGFKQKISFN